MKNLLHAVIIVLFTICYACDSTEPPITPPKEVVNNSIEITEVWKDLTEIKIKFTKSETDTISSYEYKLLTSTGMEIVYPKITGEDTSYTHTGLSEGQSVSFKVEASESKNLKGTSRTLTLTTLSSTSHNITWEIDTLGQAGNFLSDIWGIDENNVWAVGGISLASGGSTIIKWDGNSWNLHSFPDGSAYSIFGFSENEIIVVGEWANRGFIGHFDGTNWTEYKSDYFYAKGDTVYPLRAVWGSSPEDVWAVGDKRATIHWDGVEWTKIIGGTPYNQSDIWGTNSHNIFTVVFSLSNNSQLIHYNGDEWKNLTEKLPAGNRNFSSIWMDKSNQGYLVGNTTIQITDNSYSTININQYGFSTKVRGNGVNDVFIISQRGRIYHFNGKTWIYYPEVEDNLGRLNELNGIAIFENTIFIVGNSERALIYKGGRLKEVDNSRQPRCGRDCENLVLSLETKMQRQYRIKG